MHQRNSSRVHWMFFLGICVSQIQIASASPVTASITALTTTIGNETDYPSLTLTRSSAENTTLYVTTSVSNTATEFVVAYTTVDPRTSLGNETIYSPSTIATSSKGSSRFSQSVPETTQLTAAEYNISTVHETTTRFYAHMTSSVRESPASTSTLIGRSTSDTTTTLKPSSTTEKTSTPENTLSPERTSTQQISSTPQITSTPESGSTTHIASTPQITSTPEISSIPETTSTPKTTSIPPITSTTEATSNPETTSTSETTSTPKTTSIPPITSTIEATSNPETTSTSETTSTTETTSTPKTTSIPPITSTTETTSTTQCTSSTTTTKKPKKDCVINDTAFLDQLQKELIKDEGNKTKIYKDSKGNPTFGIGHKITKEDPEFGKRLGSEVTKKRIEEAYKADVKEAIESCCKLFYDFQNLPRDVQLIILNMRFNLGHAGLEGFEEFRKAVNNGDWDKAADEMVDSDWYRDVPKRPNKPNRPQRLVDRMREVGKNC